MTLPFADNSHFEFFIKKKGEGGDFLLEKFLKMELFKAASVWL